MTRRARAILLSSLLTALAVSACDCERMLATRRANGAPTTSPAPPPDERRPSLPVEPVRQVERRSRAPVTPPAPTPAPAPAVEPIAVAPPPEPPPAEVLNDPPPPSDVMLPFEKKQRADQLKQIRLPKGILRQRFGRAAMVPPAAEQEMSDQQ